MEIVSAFDGPARARDHDLVSLTHQQPSTRTGFIGAADFVRIIRRRRWLILLVALATIILTLVFLARTSPVYSTTATVMVRPLDQAAAPIGGEATPTTPTSASEETLIQTKVELLQSRVLAKQAAHSLHLEDDPEFTPAPRGKPPLLDRLLGRIVSTAPPIQDPEDQARAAERARNEATTDRLIDHLAVTRVGRSNVIAITASSHDPAKAALIANRLVDTYIRGQIDDANDNRAENIKALSKRVEEVRAYLKRADDATAAYQRERGLLNAKPGDSASAQVDQLRGLLAQASADSAAMARRVPTVPSPGGGIVASSPVLADLQAQQTTLMRRLGELNSFYGPGYPAVVQASAELAAVQARIGQEEARVVADLRLQAASSQARTASVSAAISGVKSRSFDDGKAAVALRAMERNVEVVSGLYTSLLNQLNQQIGTSFQSNPDISRVSRAPVPDEPSFPQPKRVLVVAGIAGLVLGTLLAFATEQMDNRLRTGEQVWRLLGIPTLAMVPELDAKGALAAVVTGRPRSRYAESMRNLLIELEARTPPGSRVVVVTSPIEGEGKSTIAASLAQAASVIGRRAAIVDFDLRRLSTPAAETIGPMGDQQGAGVVAYLTDRARLDDLMSDQGGTGLATIGVGEVASDPGALIASPRLPELLAQLRERFELVILNAPPILPVRDAKTLAEHADATLLVLRWGRTSPEAAAAAIEVFGRSITGAVMNRVDYAVHAGRRYGDAIHHVARSTAYYELDPETAVPLLTRIRWQLRRLAGRTVERLHLG